MPSANLSSRVAFRATRIAQPTRTRTDALGDSRDQNLLQFFLNIVDFGMTVQQATEAPNMNSYHMRSSLGAHESRPGRILVATSLPESTRKALRQMGYTLEFEERTSGPINAILFDTSHHIMWCGSRNDGEDYGIAW